MRAVQARASQVYRPACCKQVPPPFPWPGSKKSKDTGRARVMERCSINAVIIIIIISTFLSLPHDVKCAHSQKVAIYSSQSLNLT